MRRGRGYRYGRWRGGPDPLAPPYDLGNAVDEIGDSVLAGSGVRERIRAAVPAAVPVAPVTPVRAHRQAP